MTQGNVCNDCTNESTRVKRDCNDCGFSTQKFWYCDDCRFKRHKSSKFFSRFRPMFYVKTFSRTVHFCRIYCFFGSKKVMRFSKFTGNSKKLNFAGTNSRIRFT